MDRCKVISGYIFEEFSVIVRRIIKLVDPQGVELRRAQHSRRRQYSCRGPNALVFVCVEEMQMILAEKPSRQFWRREEFPYFKLNDGLFTGDFWDKSLIQYCFVNLVQVKKKILNLWNEVAAVYNYSLISHFCMYFASFYAGWAWQSCQHLKFTQNQIKIKWWHGIRSASCPCIHSQSCTVLKTDFSLFPWSMCMECTSKDQFPCDETIFELCCLLMEEIFKLLVLPWLFFLVLYARLCYIC